MFNINSYIGQLYPKFTTEEEIRHIVESLPDRHDKESPLFMLCHFIRNYSKLEAIGSSLPEMVEFYKFLFCDLAQTITEDEAFEVTVKDKVYEIARRYENCNHLPELYRLAIGMYNKYY